MTLTIEQAQEALLQTIYQAHVFFSRHDFSHNASVLLPGPAHNKICYLPVNGRRNFAIMDNRGSFDSVEQRPDLLVDIAGKLPELYEALLLANTDPVAVAVAAAAELSNFIFNRPL